MSNFSRSALGGLLFAAWMMCFVFPVGLFMAVSDHTPIADFLVQQVVNFFVLWFICGAIANVVNGMFDDMNKRGRDRDPHDLDGRSDKTRPGESEHIEDKKNNKADDSK
jgi:hypothetical protein